MESNEPTPHPWEPPTANAPQLTTMLGNTGALPPTTPGSLGAAVTASQHQTDLSHLRLLSVFYYVSAGLQALSGCLGAFWFVIGMTVMAAPPPKASNGQDLKAAPEVVGAGFMALGGCIGLFCVVWAVLSILAGVSLTAQRRRTLCLVTAGLTCLNIPLGTILGVFTFVVLSRPSVTAMFNEKRMTI